MNKYQISQEEELSLDPDNDGLSTGQEYAIGTNPYDFDTDGDGISDSLEAKHNSNPRIPTPDANSPEGLKQRYYHHASQILGWDKYSHLSWETLNHDISGQFEIGWSLDNLVYERAINTGETPDNALNLLAQSPFLQYHKEQGQIELKDLIEYSEQVVEQHKIFNPPNLEHTNSIKEPEPELEFHEGD